MFAIVATGMDISCTFPLTIIERNNPGIRRHIPIICNVPSNRESEMELMGSIARVKAAARTPTDTPTSSGHCSRVIELSCEALTFSYLGG
jgi:hypothetical protein